MEMSHVAMEMTIGVVMLSSIARTMVLTMQKNKEEFFALGMIITTKILLMTIMAVIIYSNLDRTVLKDKIHLNIIFIV